MRRLLFINGTTWELRAAGGWLVGWLVGLFVGRLVWFGLVGLVGLVWVGLVGLVWVGLVGLVWVGLVGLVWVGLVGLVWVGLVGLVWVGLVGLVWVGLVGLVWVGLVGLVWVGLVGLVWVGWLVGWLVRFLLGSAGYGSKTLRKTGLPVRVHLSLEAEIGFFFGVVQHPKSSGQENVLVVLVGFEPFFPALLFKSIYFFYQTKIC